jgi:hypothetical protein
VAVFRLHLVLRGKGEGQVVPVLFFLTEYQVMRVYWGVDVHHQFLTSAMDVGESASRSSCLTLRETAPGTHRIGGLLSKL